MSTYSKAIMEMVVSLSETLAARFLADCCAEVPVVAAIVDKNCNILALSGNEVESTNREWFHAEFLATSQAIDLLQCRHLENHSIYITLEPCAFCLAMLEKVRIKNIFFGAYNQKNGVLCKPQESQYDAVGGIQEKRCSTIMKNFFTEVRGKETNRWKKQPDSTKQCQ